MKSVLRFDLRYGLLFSFLFVLMLLQTACSSLGYYSDEEDAAQSAPIEDRSLLTRNPYAPSGQAPIYQDSRITPEESQSKLASDTMSGSASSPSLHLEEMSEESAAVPAVKHTHSLWLWPTDNAIIRQFDSADPDAKGIDFSGKVGDSIRAVRSGKVVFSGAGLKGYGQLIIIKHDSNILTAYAHNHSLLVKEGDLIDAGQVIAEMGLNEQTGIPMLHFEVRLNGKPADPSGYLPSRR